MPSQRRADQVMVSFHVDTALGRSFELERRRQGKTRSQFIREAIVEKLDKMGIAVDPKLALARDRAGNYFVAEEVNGVVNQIGNHSNFSSGASSKPYKQRRAKK